MTDVQRLADLERELTPTVVAEILAVRDDRGVPLAQATRTVARAWFDDAKDRGLSVFAADEVMQLVRRIGAGIDAPEPERLRFFPR
jgi:hypothetical protein